MKNRTLLLMVAEQRSNLGGNPLLKVRGTIPYIVFENEISHLTNVFPKQKGQTQILKNYALVDVYYVCVTCLSLDVIGF